MTSRIVKLSPASPVSDEIPEGPALLTVIARENATLNLLLEGALLVEARSTQSNSGLLLLSNTALEITNNLVFLSFVAHNFNSSFLCAERPTIVSKILPVVRNFSLNLCDNKDNFNNCENLNKDEGRQLCHCDKSVAAFIDRISKRYNGQN